ncbi:2-keto-4-pentenoate hydratase [Sphingomonas montana]|uniref:2-keto-4-pentenoate hydratase n=1 Tax=Sphingomonas montana TaxID=1843236 RepID=UPI00096FCF06|nr:hypothetical protein [Sphingomonas montana]
MDATGQGIAATAARFVAARRGADGLDAYPGTVPATLAEGYAIQDAAIALIDEPIVGWKVGRINAPLDAQHGTTRLVGPIFANMVVTLDDADTVPDMGIFADGFGAVEGEFLIRLGTIDPAQRAWTLAQAADAIATVHIGIEIASSPLEAINRLGPTVTVSDFGNNNGMIVGAAIPEFREAGLEDWTVVTEIDGVEVGRGKASAFPDGLGGSVKALLETLAARGIAVPPGTWVSSGAVSGVHPIAVGQTAVVRFDVDGENACHGGIVRCRIRAETPQA